jgi:riboflavin synthase
VSFSLPDTVAPYVIPHGSISVNGVSLTINALPDPGTAEVALIPYTYDNTNLSRLAPGSRVNLEADMIGKYVAQALSQGRPAGTSTDLQQRLSEWGIG